MTIEREHVGFESLSDFVDGLLSESDSIVIRRHLAVCGECAAEHESLRSLIKASQEAPKSMLPLGDIWPDLRKALESRKEVVLPAGRQVAGSGSVRRPQRLWWTNPRALAAAAVILVMASSGITALVLRTNQRSTVAESSSMTATPNAPATDNMLRVDFQQAENEYTRTIKELQLAVDAQRSRLNPETIRTVDHSLAVVDTAIAEARAALLSDPNNQMLVDLLSSSYQRKLDLLRRTSELSSRT